MACFYNTKRFKYLDANRIILAEHISNDALFKDLWEKVERNEKLKERILSRTTAVQTTTLQSNEMDEIIVVANTHLYFAPDADHIRLLQAGFILKYVQDVCQKTASTVCIFIGLFKC